jgi:hypothetical protein
MVVARVGIGEVAARFCGRGKGLTSSSVTPQHLELPSTWDKPLRQEPDFRLDWRGVPDLERRWDNQLFVPTSHPSHDAEIREFLPHCLGIVLVRRVVRVNHAAVLDSAAASAGLRIVVCRPLRWFIVPIHVVDSMPGVSLRTRLRELPPEGFDPAFDPRQ